MILYVYYDNYADAVALALAQLLWKYFKGAFRPGASMSARQHKKQAADIRA